MEFQFQNKRSIKAVRDGYITPSPTHVDLLLGLGEAYNQLEYLDDTDMDKSVIREYKTTHDDLYNEYINCSDVRKINNDWRNNIAQLISDVKRVYDQALYNRYLNAENERVRQEKQAREKLNNESGKKPTQRKTYTKTEFLYKGGLAGQIKRRRKSKENKRTATKRRRGRVGWRN